MKHKWLYISLAGIFGGYLAFGFISDELQPETQATTRADLHMPTSLSRDQSARANTAQRIQAARRYPPLTAVPLGAKEAIVWEHEASRLLAEEEAMVTEADAEAEAEAILAELDRLEREHGAEDGQDPGGYGDAEMSESETEHLRLDLEAKIEEEMAELEYEADDPGWHHMESILDYAPDGVWSESQTKEHRLALEAAIAEEMANLENE